MTTDSAFVLTPLGLAARLNVSLVTVLKALVAGSHYVLPDQAMDQETVNLALRNLGCPFTGDALQALAPANRRMKKSWTALHVNVCRRNLRELYHFTDLANVAGILRTGCILSRGRMAAQGIRPVQNDWGSAEKESALGVDHICLSLTKQWAMMRSVMIERAELPAVFVIEPRVIWYEGTCFSQVNSARRDVSATDLVRWITERDFDVLFPNATSNWPCDPQAEVLVRDTIPMDDVRHIVFCRREAFESVWSDAGLDRSNPYIGKVLISERFFPLGKR